MPEENKLQLKTIPKTPVAAFPCGSEPHFLTSQISVLLHIPSKQCQKSFGKYHLDIGEWEGNPISREQSFHFQGKQPPVLWWSQFLNFPALGNIPLIPNSHSRSAKSPSFQLRGKLEAADGISGMGSMREGDGMQWECGKEQPPSHPFPFFLLLLTPTFPFPAQKAMDGTAGMPKIPLFFFLVLWKSRNFSGIQLHFYHGLS